MSENKPVWLSRVIRIAPTASMDVLLGLPPLHVTIEVEAQAGICRIMCSQ
jgi:hypothetical protein